MDRTPQSSCTTAVTHCPVVLVRKPRNDLQNSDTCSILEEPQWSGSVSGGFAPPSHQHLLPSDEEAPQTPTLPSAPGDRPRWKGGLYQRLGVSCRCRYAGKTGSCRRDPKKILGFIYSSAHTAAIVSEISKWIVCRGGREVAVSSITQLLVFYLFIYLFY